MEASGESNLENDKQTRTKNSNKATKILKQSPLIYLGNWEGTVVGQEVK